MRKSFSRNWPETVRLNRYAAKSIELGPGGAELSDFEACLVVFHSRRRPPSVKRRRFSGIRVAHEGTGASFSTVLAFGVLEILGSLLALSRDCLLFFVGLRALA